MYRAGLLPGRIKALLGPDLFRFAKWDRQHLIFRPLSDPQQGDLRRIAFHHLCQVEPAPAARVLASAQGGEPLLVEGRVERGTVLLFASAADLDWGDWPKGRLFVPLVHQMIGYLAERLPENAAVQSAPTGPGRDNPPGITRTERAVVVRNLDPRESEMEQLSERQFREALQLVEKDSGSSQARPPGAAERAPGSQRPDELWAFVLWTLLLVLVAEVFIANRTHA